MSKVQLRCTCKRIVFRIISPPPSEASKDLANLLERMAIYTVGLRRLHRFFLQLGLESALLPTRDTHNLCHLRRSWPSGCSWLVAARFALVKMCRHKLGERIHITRLSNHLKRRVVACRSWETHPKSFHPFYVRRWVA